MSKPLDHEGAVRPHWDFLIVQALIREEIVPGVPEQYEFRVDNQVFHIAVSVDTAEAGNGPATDPVLVVRADARAFVDIGSGYVSPFTAVASQRIAFEGPQEAVLRCCNLLGLAPE